jgi:CHASE2 domain
MGLRTWLAANHEARRYALVAAAGLCIMLFTIFAGGKQLKDAYEDMTSPDQLVKLSTFFSGAGSSAFPVTLIAIDDETRAAWGAPQATPQAALAVLVRQAREAKAKAILLDIDLSPEYPVAKADLALLSELAKYPPDAPLLMIVRAVRFRAGKGSFEAEALKASPYDAVVASKPNIVWTAAIPEFANDRVVRKIRLWQTVCDGASGAAFAAPALHVAALEGNRGEALRMFLADEAAAECGNVARTHQGWPARKEAGARIPFVVWGDADTIGADFIATPGGDALLIQKASAFRLARFDGSRAEPVGAVATALFEGRVAVIGVTHAESRDVHATPLGTMPGAVILANTLAMAGTIADTPERSYAEKLAFIVPIFAVLGLLGIRLQVAAATIIVGSIALVLLVILSRLLGFAAAAEIMAYALVMYGLLKLSDSLLTIIHDWRKGVGWRAIFKPRH